jgi:dephospho-CoA kinase
MKGGFLMKIAVTGEIRSGKDTVCEYIQEQYPKMEKLYFAEGIREIIERYFPESMANGQKPRKHYQDIGQFMRTIDIDVWVNQVNDKYRYLNRWRNIEDFICTDLRQPNEYEWLKKNGFTVIKVECEPELRIERMKASGDKFEMQDLVHPVEQQIKALPSDYIISNNTTLADLYEQVDFILNELKDGE